MIDDLRQEWLLLVLITAIVIGVGWLVGALAAPAAGWVTQLVMPPFLLPQAVSSALTFILSIAFAIVGWRIWLHSSTLALDMLMWGGILVLSWIFTPAFLVLRVTNGALGIIIAMTLMAVVLNGRLAHSDRFSAVLLAPSTIWLAYTASLTAWVMAFNQV